MAAYNGKSKTIKNAIKTLVSTIKYDTGSGEEDAFTLITDSTAGEFDSSPVLQILPGDVTTTKGTTAQNDRVVALILRTHLQIEGDPGNESAVVDHMYDLTDLLIDQLDQGDQDGALAGTGTGAWILNATRGDWTVVPQNEGAVLMCDVNVEVKYSKDL
jgi:hypothetical protein